MAPAHVHSLNHCSRRLTLLAMCPTTCRRRWTSTRTSSSSERTASSCWAPPRSTEGQFPVLAHASKRIYLSGPVPCCFKLTSLAWYRYTLWRAQDWGRNSGRSLIYCRPDLRNLTYGQCAGIGSVESVSFPWIRIRIKKWLDPESGSVSNDTDPDPTNTIENIK